MKTIILDDDPTGTQSATGALVLLQLDREALGRALAERDSVYVQTNSRALDEAAAVALVQRIRGLALDVAAELGDEVRFVLRGDSTLRGHVFAETAELLADDDVIVFAPAFPEGGRTTRGGVHYVRIDGVDVPAHETEYADDPVFPFRTAVMVDYVREASGRRAVSVPLESVRSGGLVQVILDAAPGTVIVPDAVDAADIAAIAAALDAAWAAGAGVVVRSASPLAAAIADVSSVGLLPVPLVADPRRVLLACGSHTHGATRQLALVEERWGDPTVLDTAAALADPVAEGHRAASVERERLAGAGFGYVTTARERSTSHGTLAHGESVMTALTTAVADLLGDADVVVAKGGITSAEVASSGIGATSALVLGQVLPGVSVWQVTGRDGRDRLYVVVPGNVGGPETLVDVLRAVGAPETEVVR